jgi:hypothetical protein
MASGTFHLVRFDEGGPKGKPDNRRLVCVTQSGGKLAIWGQEVPTREMRNIEAVLKAGMPCTVECEYREPGEFGVRFGHTHWVRQDFKLRVISG